MSNKPIYARVLLKISGEMLAGDMDFGIDSTVLRRLAGELKEVAEMGVQMGLVIGGGNIFRGISGSEKGMDRAHADYMGMLATVINALAMQDALESVGCKTRVVSALRMEQVCEPYIRRRAVAHLAKGRVVIFAAGTGNPYFSTDSAAALRAAEIGADVILKATKVDGVYDKDPKKFADAVRFETIAPMEAFKLGLKVADATAIALAMENNTPMIVFDLGVPGNIKRVVLGEPVGTIVITPRAAGGTP